MKFQIHSGAHSSRRLFEIMVVGICLITGLALQLDLAWRDSATSDEPVHLLSGYLALRYGDHTIDPEHPFFLKKIAAFPLLFLDVQFPPGKDELLAKSHNFFYDVRREGMEYADEWLFYEGNNPEQLMFTARLPVIGITLLLGFCLYLLGRRLFGWRAGLGVLVLFTLDPNLLAHGHQINTDVGIALFFLLSICTWAWYLSERSGTALFAAGLALGLTMLAKFSATVLLPTMFIITIVRLLWFEREDKRPFSQKLAALVRPILLIGCMTHVIIWLGYGAPLAIDQTVRNPIHDGEAYWMNEGILFQLFAVPAFFFKGFWLLLRDMFFLRDSYLFGQVKAGGWWYYFPVAFFLKTPLPVTILLFLSVMWRIRQKRRLTWPEAVLTIAPAVFMFFSMTGKMNIGLRHILPLYPFLYLWIGQYLGVLGAAVRGSFRLWAQRGAVGLLAIWLAVGSLNSYPHMLSYFNELVRPADKWKVLTDSNLDWGQNVKELPPFFTEAGVSSARCVYFWSKRQLVCHGVPCQFVAWPEDLPTDGSGEYVLIDAMFLKDDKWNIFWHKPVYASIDGTIFVYKF